MACYVKFYCNVCVDCLAPPSICVCRVCYRRTSFPLPYTTYLSVSQIYFTSCGWLNTNVCQRFVGACSVPLLVKVHELSPTCMILCRTRYIQVSQISFRTVYSQVSGCCDGYVESGSNNCSRKYIDKFDTIHVDGKLLLPNLANCSSDCLNGGNCTAPNTCSCETGWTGNTCETGMHIYTVTHTLFCF